MKKVSLLIVLMVVLFVLSGCLQSHRTIHVKKDGSGTIEEKMLIGSMGSMMGGIMNSSDVEKLKADAASFGEGVQYVSSKEITENDMSGYEVVYSFADISKVKIDMNAAGKIMQMGEESDIAEYVTFDFKKGKNAELKVIFPRDMDDESEQIEGEVWDEDEEVGAGEDEQDMAMQMAKSMYGNMEISIKIVIDVKITSTDATHIQENEVILQEIIFTEMLEDEKALKAMEKSEDMSDSERMKLIEDFPGVKVELKDEISIKFK